MRQLKGGRGWTRLGLVGLVFIGFGLRLYQIDHFSFWIDEALTPLRSSYSLIDILRNVIYVQGHPTTDTHLPFYYLIIHFTSFLIGESDFSYRIPSALFATLSIPLMFVWGRQIGYSLFPERADQLGFAAALWMALNPLSVWYSQEARMYTLLTLIGIGLNLIMWLAIERSSQAEGKGEASSAIITRWLIGYAILALIGVTTHVTTVFLAAGHGLLWAWLLWTRTRYGGWLVSGTVLAGLAALPLLPIFVPRLFTPPESGFTTVSFFTIFYDLIGGYSMGVSAPDIPWLRTTLWLIYLAVILITFVSLFRQRRTTLAIYLLLSLLFPAIGNGAVTNLVKPMYQGIRHIMLGGPAFLMVLAIFTMGDVRYPVSGDRISDTGHRPSPISLLFSLFSLLGFLLALNSLYTNPDVAKDDLRSLVARIEERAGSSDIVIYNDVILMLVHEHYATRDDLIVTSLPVYPGPVIPQTTLDLERFSGIYERMWFIPSPPTDDRDKEKVVGSWLKENVQPLDERWFAARSTELKVEGFQTDVGNRQLEISVGEAELDLLAVTPRLHGPSQLWIETAWRGPAPSPETEIIFRLEGTDDWEWIYNQQRFLFLSADDREQNLTPEWDADGFNRRQFGIPRPIGLSAGTYFLTIELNDGGAQTARYPHVAELWLGPPASLPAPRPLADQRVAFEKGLFLEDLELADEAVRPGHILPAHAVWTSEQSTEGLTGLEYQMQVFGPGNQLVFERSGRQGEDWPPISAENPTRDHVEIIFPAAAEPGLYEIRWQLRDTEGPLAAQTGWWPFGREWQAFGTVEVTPWPMLEEVPPVNVSLKADFSGVGQLIGSNITQAEGQLLVDNVWKISAKPNQNFFSFVHIVDQTSGDIVAQRDWIPVEGLRPTEGWRPGEVIIDPHIIDLNALPSGQYDILTGLYSPGSFERPAVTQAGEEIVERQVWVGEIER
ncbi:MAG: hypothetical protein AAF633_15360 [Chloroflexota bacterium]